MTIRMTSTVLLAISLLAGGVVASTQARPSTPEERQRIVELARRLQENPLDKQLTKEREWAILWLIQVPDITVSLCGRELGDFPGSKYKYAGEITAVSLLSSAALAIEDPERGSDPQAQYQASAAGVLKAYRSILKTEPKARSKVLDRLLAADERGEREKTVAQNAKRCR